MEKKQRRQRRARRTRAKIKKRGILRLCVHRTPRHIYAQVIASDGASVIASASTIMSELRKSLKVTGN
ncbi:MAG: 50S ribosomal protein L18, partial [Gammaproteobacteria bacterium]|nr:50S ribosomal protein L18 [Gammaproteobacteria bacterium]